MKLNIVALATLVAMGVIAHPHSPDMFSDNSDAQQVDIVAATREAQILSYLLKVQAKEESLAEGGIIPYGCHWEGTAPFCAANKCRRGYTERDRSGCGDGACCVTGMKLLCCTA